MFWVLVLVRDKIKKNKKNLKHLSCFKIRFSKNSQSSVFGMFEGKCLLPQL